MLGYSYEDGVQEIHKQWMQVNDLFMQKKQKQNPTLKEGKCISI